MNTTNLSLRPILNQAVLWRVPHHADVPLPVHLSANNVSVDDLLRCTWAMIVGNTAHSLRIKFQNFNRTRTFVFGTIVVFSNPCEESQQLQPLPVLKAFITFLVVLCVWIIGSDSVSS